MDPPHSPCLKIAIPCPANPIPFAAGEKSRLCELCNTQVHNLTALAYDDAVNLLSTERHTACFAFKSSPSGKLLTADSSGLESSRGPRWPKRLLALAVVAAIMLLTKQSLEGINVFIMGIRRSTSFDPIHETALYQKAKPVRKVVDWAESALSPPDLGSDDMGRLF